MGEESYTLSYTGKVQDLLAFSLSGVGNVGFFQKLFFERRGVERCLALLIWLIENVEFHSSFSRHGIAQAVLGSAHLAYRKRSNRTILQLYYIKQILTDAAFPIS